MSHCHKVEPLAQIQQVDRPIVRSDSVRPRVFLAFGS